MLSPVNLVHSLFHDVEQTAEVIWRPERSCTVN